MNVRCLPYEPAKRAFDVVTAAVALSLSLPLLVVGAVLVAATMGRPVFFLQQRPGLHGRPFGMIKLRSMRNPDPARGLISDRDRLTALGRVLRATSVDELPALWNVLRGDMSIVGPRPLLMRYLDRYTPTQTRRHEVRPGLTGLAQVRGRNALPWEQKFALDVWYVDHRSFALDVRIVAETVVAVILGRGISAADSATAPEFLGTPAGRPDTAGLANGPR